MAIELWSLIEFTSYQLSKELKFSDSSNILLDLIFFGFILETFDFAGETLSVVRRVMNWLNLVCHWDYNSNAISLTHWGWDKMDAISQTTSSNAFSWMKMHEFRLRFHWNLFLRFELTIFQHWFRYWLGAGQATSHYLNQWWLVYWRIYASLGLNELIEVAATHFEIKHVECLIFKWIAVTWLKR